MEELISRLRQALGPGYRFRQVVPVWDSYRIWIERDAGGSITVDVPDVIMDSPSAEDTRSLVDTIRSAFGELPPEAGDHARFQPRRI